MQVLLQQTSLFTQLDHDSILLLLPVAVALVSFGTIVLQYLVFNSPFNRWILPQSRQLDPLSGGASALTSIMKLRVNVTSNGGPLLWFLKLLRFLGCGTLVTIFIFSPKQNPPGSHGLGIFPGISWTSNHEGSDTSMSRTLYTPKCVQEALIVFYIYAAILALFTIVLSSPYGRQAKHHLDVLLASVWAVYIYRDIWPLATYTKKPQDPNVWTTWVIISVLTVVAIVVPLLMPREYFPVDKQNPGIPNPEQTASWLGFFSYTFMDPVIYRAARSDHLQLEEFPVLADYDHAEYLRKRSLKKTDPFLLGRQRHLGISLLLYFYKEFSALALLLTIRVAALFAAPIAINRLLTYIETKGEGAEIKPWFWICCLFFGPLISSLSFQWYIFINTSTLVRCQAIITLLLFEHAFRIRVKEDIPSIEKQSRGITEESSGSRTASTLSTTQNDKNQKSAQSTPVTRKSTNDKNKSGFIGRINNFITTDLSNITPAVDFLLPFWLTPLQVIISTWFLTVILGPSALLGLGVMIVSLPIPSLLAQISNRLQKERMRRTDSRVQKVTEILNIIRMVKMFSWESKVEDLIAERREEELLWMRKRRLLDILSTSVNVLLPVLTMLVTYSSYTLLFKQKLTASRVFSSIAVFNMLRGQMFTLVWGVSMTIQAKVSLDRLTHFLNNTELLDKYHKDDLISGPELHYNSSVCFHNASFLWTAEEDGINTPGRRSFRLKVEGDLEFPKGVISLITGPTGCGKTSVLMALLGEMHFQPLQPDGYFNLPRSGGVSFASQESWVQNDTIKSNIVFGYPFDEERYKKVLYQCALEKDLELFETGDETEVGERGLTLSGGQKARVTLARAIYAPSQTVLLDDVLSALDIHTSKWIVEKCLKGDLLKGRTVILVTHNIAIARQAAKFIVAMQVDGRIASQGIIEEIIVKNSKLDLETKRQLEEDIDRGNTQTQNSTTVNTESGKLIVTEEVALGRVGWSALKIFLVGIGGVLLWTVILGCWTLSYFSGAMEQFWLGHWASQYESTSRAEVNVPYYIGVYCLIVLASMTLTILGDGVYLLGALSASRKIHAQLTDAILHTTFRWLDMTPIGRIISRFTLDIAAVDGDVMRSLLEFLEKSLFILVRFSSVVFWSPIFVVPGFIVAGLGALIGNKYIKAQLPVKREMSKSRSPVISHFNTSIAALVSIRAYGAQDLSRIRSMELINNYTRAARTFFNLNRWVNIRIDTLGSLLSTLLAIYLIYIRPVSAGAAGFSLSMAVSFTSTILWWVRSSNNLEVACNSLERIQIYTHCDQEVKSSETGRPPAYWPTSGDLQIQGLSASYSAGGPEILHNISFEIKSGERIGVVGRTGSGKSTLTLALMRLIPTNGSVYYDGILTEKLNLDALRQNINIIPQQPELLSGSLRENLDPFGEHDDAVLNDALRAAGLFNIQSENEDDHITLDTAISASGGNFSLGQRQIIALARAIVRKTKVLILDEATAAVDHDTDNLIQHSIRHELRDVTVITVAHRLKTIGDSDKILVLDAGRLVEFDSPRNLLLKTAGRFKSLVDESGEKGLLYRMAGFEVSKD